ncbi:hypothetical protein AB205_0094780 [Aquarana catesbeiana]|uniref:Exportin-1 n=1 Tax=Aquarana catesbeiana TaxID=8400 RepID=A0A2G9RHN3_AQUCT|nr:hypothetical protein AB205_0094780 [Aquarana catesbeiana]
MKSSVSKGKRVTVLRTKLFLFFQILKQEWPKHWPTFISDIVGASKTSESLCQNNMVILKLLSEEVFDFSTGQITQVKAKHLKDSMCNEFSKIFQLCQFVMENSQNAPLVHATLETLLRFLNWIPLGYIFETKLISTLIYKFLNVPMFRNVSLKCLTEIAGVSVSQYEEQFVTLFTLTMMQLKQMLPLNTNIRLAYANGKDDEQNFIQNLSLFLCTFLKEHGQLIEKRLNLRETLMEDLLGLCEQKRGKDNKAIIASNIMYIVGQYPRFLRAHWKFLKTVVNKLFEFMHETHDGVQDMACDTFIKIAQKCRRHFVQVQVGEVMPFIDEILNNINTIICDLQPQQVHTFYEAVGYMIGAQTDQPVQEHLIEKYMLLPNQVWDSIIQQATKILYTLLQNVAQEEAAAQSFYQTYFCDVLQHIFSVVTDTSHTAGLTMHASILAYMFNLVEEGKISVPLNPAVPPNNQIFIQDYVANLLKSAFPHLQDAQVKLFVTGLFSLNQDIPAFKEHLRDFLVQIKEFAGEDTSDLFLEERETALRQAQEEKHKLQMSVPGILNPHEIPEEMCD